MVGATGTIGRATAHELVRQGYEVVCFVRARANTPFDVPGAIMRTGDVTNSESLAREGFRDERFDAVVSCMASRTGAPHDAWAIDHRAQLTLLAAAASAGVSHFVLLSAICVQKPKLAFQHAKLAFETALQQSGLTWSIVRPTAFFKSISGQVERVKQGKPFLVFGDGTLTSCKPISDGDLAAFIVGCLSDSGRYNRVLPIGGPGLAITPRDQGEFLFSLLGRPPRFKQVPPGLLQVIARLLGMFGRVIPPLAAKAEFARIGHYYATESMLVWDDVRQRYDAEATPSTGQETLLEYYAQLVRGDVSAERGDHAVF